MKMTADQAASWLRALEVHFPSREVPELTGGLSKMGTRQ